MNFGLEVIGHIVNNNRASCFQNYARFLISRHSVFASISENLNLRNIKCGIMFRKTVGFNRGLNYKKN